MFRLLMLLVCGLSFIASCHAQKGDDPESFGFASEAVTNRLEVKLLLEQETISVMAAFAPREADKMRWAFDHYQPTGGKPITFDWEKRKTFIGGEELPEGKITVVFVTRLPTHLVPFLQNALGTYEETVRTVFIIMPNHETDESAVKTVFHEFCHVYDIAQGAPSTTEVPQTITVRTQTKTLIITQQNEAPAVAFEAPAYLCGTAFLGAKLERLGVLWRQSNDTRLYSNTRLTAEIYHHIHGGKGDEAFLDASTDAFLFKEFRRMLDTRIYPTLYEDKAQKLWLGVIQFYMRTANQKR